MKLFTSFALVLAGFAILSEPTFGASVSKVSIEHNVKIEPWLVKIVYQEFEKFKKAHPNEVYELINILGSRDWVGCSLGFVRFKFQSNLSNLFNLSQTCPKPVQPVPYYINFVFFVLF